MFTKEEAKLLIENWEGAAKYLKSVAKITLGLLYTWLSNVYPKCLIST